jgi:hypothetical protein
LLFNTSKFTRHLDALSAVPKVYQSRHGSWVVEGQGCKHTSNPWILTCTRRSWGDQTRTQKDEANRLLHRAGMSTPWGLNRMRHFRIRFMCSSIWTRESWRFWFIRSYIWHQSQVISMVYLFICSTHSCLIVWDDNNDSWET